MTGFTCVALRTRGVDRNVEIRKGVCGANLLIVMDKSVNDPKETNAHCVSVSMNGTGVLTWQDITELKQAITEAAEMLKT